MLLTGVLVAFVIAVAGMIAPRIPPAPTLSANPYAQSGIIHCWIGVQTDHIGVRQGRPSRPHFTRAYHIHGGSYDKLRQYTQGYVVNNKTYSLDSPHTDSYLRSLDSGGAQGRLIEAVAA